jgi:predicted phosphodiesterase
MAESNNLKKFAETVQDRDPRKSKKKIEHPKGFNPSVSYSQQTKSGEIVSEPQKENKIDWKEQLESYFGADAKNYRVLEDTAEIRFWDMAGNPPQRLYYFKAKIVSNKAYMPDDDFKKILQEAKRKKPKPKKKPVKDSKTFVICLSDFQVGKAGTENVVERFVDYIDKTVDHIKTLQKYENINQVLYAGLGDILEGTCGFYPMQEFSVSLDARQQQKVARRMIYRLIKETIPLFDKGLVAFIGGNHAENRKNGKAYTSFGDNKDVMLAEELQEIFKEAPAYKDKLDFMIPENELSLTFEISDVVISMIHGHQLRSGTNAQAKQRNWLANQSLSRNAISDCDILLSAHFHFFSAYETSDRLLLQASTIDDGSEWFENTMGDKSRAGLTTLVIGGSEKWSNIRVIR